MRQRISTLILAAAYVLFIGGGAYFTFTSEISVLWIIFLILMVITLLAILGIGGKGVWVIGLVYSMLILVLGIGATALWLWEFVFENKNTPEAVLVGIGLALFGYATSQALFRINSKGVGDAR